MLLIRPRRFHRHRLDDILGGPTYVDSLLGAGFRAIRRILLLRLLLDGLLQFMKDVEFFELRMRGHRYHTISNLNYM